MVDDGPLSPPFSHPSLTTSTADFLATVPLFGGLDRGELQQFAELSREKTFPKGSVILFENDPGDSLYVIRAGRCKVVLAESPATPGATYRWIG